MAKKEVEKVEAELVREGNGFHVYNSKAELNSFCNTKAEAEEVANKLGGFIREVK